MPKEELVINNFEGGLMDYQDPRDIPDNSLARADNVMVDKFGKIRSMGREVVHHYLGGPLNSSVEQDRLIPGNFSQGRGLHIFSSDHPITKNSGQNLVTIGNPGSGESTVTMAAGTHNLSKGEYVYIEGSSLSGRYQIEERVSDTQFKITNGVTPGTNERFYWYRDTSGDQEHELYAVQNSEHVTFIDQVALRDLVDFYPSNPPSANLINHSYYSV